MDQEASQIRKSVLERFGKMVELRRHECKKSTYKLSEELTRSPAIICSVEIGGELPTDAEREAVGLALGLSIDTLPKMLRTAFAAAKRNEPAVQNMNVIKNNKSNVVQLDAFRK